jgi:hypothetical protein
VTGQWKTIRDIVLIGPLGIVGLLGGVFAVPFMVMRVMAWCWGSQDRCM